jgi:HEAT repeat protein
MMTRRQARRFSIGAVVLSTIWINPVAAATEAQCRGILQQALEDKNPDTRKQAVLALSLLGTQFLTPLKGMLHDEDVEVRLAAVASVTEVKSPQALAALREALDDEVPEVSFAAAKALWGVRDDAGRQALLAILGGETKTASNFLSKRKREALRTVRSRRALLLFAMHRSIGFAPVPYLGVGVASMQALLNDPSISGRATAALMLAHERDQATLDGLRDALTDKDWSVRAAAVHALAMRRAPRLKNDLAPLLEDQNQAVRLRAAAGYLAASARPARPAGGAAARAGAETPRRDGSGPQLSGSAPALPPLLAVPAK